MQRPLFKKLSAPIDSVLNGLDTLFNIIPFPLAILIFLYFAYKTNGLKFAIITVIGLVFIDLVDLWSESMTTLAMMAWVVLDVPFVVAFNIENPPNGGWDWHRTCAFAVDVFFMCDVVLNFNTGIETKGGGVSLNRRDIAYDYVTSWFLVDVVSAFPLDLLLDQSAAQGTQLAKLSKASRVVNQDTSHAPS